ncbi:hypothetical protein PIB30_045638, partial [Stylosanthes scabra]|nr:hypothetical protein [Stylosanthes scabra]
DANNHIYVITWAIVAWRTRRTRSGFWSCYWKIFEIIMCMVGASCLTCRRTSFQRCKNSVPRYMYALPAAPKIKRKPGRLKTKRRKDVDEGPSGSKKAKNTTNLKQQYKEFTCAYSDVRSHTKRSCKHRKADDATIAQAAATAASAAAQQGTDAAAHGDEASGPNLEQVLQSEIDLTQPSYSQPDQVQHPNPPTPNTVPQVARPNKLPPKRKLPLVDQMQGASARTTSRLQSIYKMIPTLGFQPPRKK